MNNKYKGILYIIAAGFFFALMTFFIRLSGNLPTMEKAFFRNSIAIIASLIILSRTDDKFHVQKGSLPSLILRSTFGTVGLLLNFYAIDRINIADANMLNKLSPFFAIIASYFLLKEKANFKEWIVVFTAFLGALFIIKPSFQLASVYSFMGALGGLCAGIAYTFVRKLGKNGERGPIIVLFFSVFSTIICLPFFIFDFEPMTIQQLLILICAGITATGGQLCITKAYTLAPAKEISVFDYSQVIFATLLGFIFFGQLPDIYSIIGYIIILSCAAYKWFYNNKKTDLL